ncbi:MAG: hybrid sensor histidine kinase/response regulator [Planctomycetaceae bacterium]|nr:hybrid sensor histidine kinase/response regulator [Planctomycetaceae bacterium]
MKVLVAEDSLTMRVRLAAQLRKWNYDVVEAVDGAQAWELFQQSPFSLVLTDWVMPNADGLELIRRIRDAGRSEYVYIVLLTAKSDKEDLIHAMEAGADDFLPKSSDSRELRVRLMAGERIIQLEHRLMEQHRQLQEAQLQLIQTEKMASVGQLAAGMAHEVNNPIAFVANNLAVLQRDLKSVMALLDTYRSTLPVLQQAVPEQAAEIEQQQQDCDLDWLSENLTHLFESSSAGLRRVRSIVLRLREFAHLDEGDVDEMDVVSAMEATLEVLGRELAEKQLTCQRQWDSHPVIVCQPARIKQAMFSIVMNAIQASREGGQLEVSVAENPLGVVWTVTDHGDGMDEVTQRRIFEPFFTTRPVGGGQGLGLSVAYSTIQDHQGRIEFDSVSGKGTVFRVQLPYRPVGFR